MAREFFPGVSHPVSHRAQPMVSPHPWGQATGAQAPGVKTCRKLSFVDSPDMEVRSNRREFDSYYPQASTASVTTPAVTV